MINPISGPLSESFNDLINDVRRCVICTEVLPLGPRPVVQVHPGAKILIAGQAPGRRVHESGIPFDDPSGDRLRLWMGVSREEFYDPEKVSILPMGFCYPGTGTSGDLPPRPECAPAWRERLMGVLSSIELTIVLGKYAIAWHFGDPKWSVTRAAEQWESTLPAQIALPHPSPRNNLWLKKHPWFQEKVIPVLQARVRTVLSQ